MLELQSKLLPRFQNQWSLEDNKHRLWCPRFTIASPGGFQIAVDATFQLHFLLVIVDRAGKGNLVRSASLIGADKVECNLAQLECSGGISAFSRGSADIDKF